MFRQLVAFLIGHLRIVVRCHQPERFINLCLEAEIPLWAMVRTPEFLAAEIPLPAFFRIRPIARQSGARIRIKHRRGLPFLLQRLRGRPPLLAGAALCLLALWWVTGHVWIVTVKLTGEGLLDVRAIRAVAEDAGLRPGAWKGKLDLAAVEKQIAKAIPEVSWSSVAVRGIRADIQVVEKTGYSPVEGSWTDLVARKQGMIAHLVTFSGEPAVRVGDYVQPGDTLIRGCLHYWGGGRPQVLPGTPRPPRDTVARCGTAEGEVRARVWYEQIQRQPLYREVRKSTGQEQRSWVLKWRDQEILKWGASARPWAAYDERRQTLRFPGWRNWEVPVELVSLIAVEVDVERAPLTVEQAVSEAKHAFVRQLQFQLGPTDRIASVHAEVVQAGQEYAEIRVTVETLEEIGVAQEMSGLPPDPQPDENR